MTNSKYSRDHTIDTPQQYHGDLRKGAYLQRRAAYQMQASSTPSTQAATLPAERKSRT